MDDRALPDQHRIWDDAWGGYPPGPANGFARRCAARYAPMSAAPLDVLELGCGGGADALYFARLGHRVTAVDFSPSAVAATAAAARRRDLALTVRRVDYARPPLPFPDGAFDLVYSHLSLHYFPDELTVRLFAEVRRVLRPGGVCCVRCKSPDDPLYGQGERLGEDIYCRDGHVRHFFSREYLAAQLADFAVLNLRRTSSRRGDHRIACVEAVARRP